MEGRAMATRRGLRAAGLLRSGRCASVVLHHKAAANRDVRIPTSMVAHSTLCADAPRRYSAEQDLLPRTIRQQPIDEPASASDDLAGQTDEMGNECLELHLDDLPFEFVASLTSDSAPLPR